MHISNVRFILINGPKLIWKSLDNNIEACLDINESYILRILDGLVKGTYKRADLLEIQEDTKVMDVYIEKSIRKWHIGGHLGGRTLKYKDKFYPVHMDYQNGI